MVCFTSQLCHRRFLKPVAGPFDFQLCAGYASAPLPRPLSGAADFTVTGSSALFFRSLLRQPASRPVRTRPTCRLLTARRPGLRVRDVIARDVTSPPGVPPGPPGPGVRLLTAGVLGVPAPTGVSSALLSTGPPAGGVGSYPRGVRGLRLPGLLLLPILPIIHSTPAAGGQSSRALKSNTGTQQCDLQNRKASKMQIQT